MKSKYIITESQLKLLESSNELLQYKEIDELNGKTVRFLYKCDDDNYQERIIARILKVEHRVWRSIKSGEVYDNIILTLESVLGKSEPYRLRFVNVNGGYFETLGDNCYYLNEKLSDYIIKIINDRPDFETKDIETDF